MHKNIWLLPPTYLAGVGDYDTAIQRYWTRSTKVDNVAIIAVRGVISKSMWNEDDNPAFVSKLIQIANDDSTVDAIVLRIDSPGGSVAGIREFVDAINASAKKIVCFADRMESGAFWAGTQGDYVIASNELVPTIGNVGAYYVHKDWSKYYAEMGLKTSIIASQDTPRKTDGNPYEPLSPEAKAAMQAEVDAISQTFKTEVKKARGAKLDETALDGRSFTPEQAKTLGLIDKIGALEDAIAKAKSLAGTPTTNIPKPKPYFNMSFIEKFPKLAKALGFKAEAKAQADESDEQKELNDLMAKAESAIAAKETEVEALKKQLAEAQAQATTKANELEAKAKKLEADNQKLAKKPADKPTKLAAKGDASNAAKTKPSAKSWETKAWNKPLFDRMAKAQTIVDTEVADDEDEDEDE
jgi:protease IV